MERKRNPGLRGSDFPYSATFHTGYAYYAYAIFGLIDGAAWCYIDGACCLRNPGLRGSDVPYFATLHTGYAISTQYRTY